ncbi:(4Fe-4S)-binding protein [Flavobacteriaceae bacterium MHTCC 0001]
MRIEAKEFSNSEITVTYDPCVCKLSRTCSKELSHVFSDTVIPWINLDDAKTEDIIRQIRKCPSGALQFYKKHHKLAI